jgi:K+-sensing histidine kinase KdpD
MAQLADIATTFQLEHVGSVSFITHQTLMERALYNIISNTAKYADNTVAFHLELR